MTALWIALMLILGCFAIIADERFGAAIQRVGGKFAHAIFAVLCLVAFFAPIRFLVNDPLAAEIGAVAFVAGAFGRRWLAGRAADA